MTVEAPKGHPAEAGLPTLQKLGFPTSTTSDSFTQPSTGITSIAQSWLSTFSSYASKSDPNIDGIINDLILNSSFDSSFMRGDSEEAKDSNSLSAYWRDVLALTWSFRTFESSSSIRQFLTDRLPNAGISNVRLAGTEPPSTGEAKRDSTNDTGNLLPDPNETLHATAPPPTLHTPFPDLAWIQFIFTFDTHVGECQGVVRLVPQLIPSSAEPIQPVWKAHTILTTLVSLHGAPEKSPLSSPATIPTPDSTSRTHKSKVLIIGAGQSGLTLAARLKSFGLSLDDIVLVEKNGRIGDNWRKRYAALKLHDPIWYDHLPYMPFPDDWPIFTSAKQLGDWLETYAKALSLNIWTSSEVTKAVQDPVSKQWDVTVRVRRGATSEGEEHTFTVNHLVFATGFVGEPYMPDLPGKDKFQGTILHSSQHHSAADHVGKKVLVVGACTSAHDICLDYVTHNKTSPSPNYIAPTMYQRSSTYIISSAGVLFLLSSLYSDAPDAPPTEIADLLNMSSMVNWGMAGVNRRVMLALKEGMDRELVEGLNARGFKTNEGFKGTGLMGMVWDKGGGYYFDVGASRAIIDGQIQVRGGNGSVVGYTEHGVLFEDGSEEKADVVIFCTGLGNAHTGIARICGKDVAAKTAEIWGLSAEGEIKGCWVELGPEGLWNMMGNLGICRIHSRHLALQIKALEDGIVKREERYI